ncbi:uncharacterized protein LOC143890998 [Tasmannia lanceolata]|uniref:uncharacterized protein LOC143890998 n=1 Tax=Tasmannia lanceolata TaxID=3420 RepID=UPI0040634BC3
MPQLPHHDGTTDPVDHLETFKMMMLIHGVSGDFMCRAYPATLVGAARDWYSSLRPSSIRSFEEFGDQLGKHFLSSRRTRKTTASLMTVKQHTGESLKDFIARFNKEALQIPNLDPSTAMNALLSGVKSADFRMSIAKKAPTSLADLITRVVKYITAEETLSPLNLIPEADNETKRKVREEERGTSTPNQRSCKEDKSQRRDGSPKRKEGSKRDKSRYCRYHKDHRHDTDECRHLKEEIVNLIKRGHLRDFMKKKDRPVERESSHKTLERLSPAHSNAQEQRSPTRERRPSQPAAVINTIVGGLTAGGTSASGQKAYARQISSAHIPSKRPRTDRTISFSDADLEGVLIPHNDVMVIDMIVSDLLVKKVLVDNGSSADILYYHAFKQMGVPEDRLKPFDSHLYHFSGNIVPVEGSVELLV